MKIIAKAVKGHEFLYSAKTAHAVSERSANTIMNILNDRKWRLGENEVWNVFEVGHYDNAYDYAEDQKFTIRKGIVREIKC